MATTHGTVQTGEAGREAIRAAGLRLGFQQIGFARAERPVHADHLREWLGAGMHGEMAWMAREDAIRRRLDPSEALPGCRTLVMASMAYGPGLVTSSPHLDGASRCRHAIIARYAQGRDYHLVFEERLSLLATGIQSVVPGSDTRTYVDYGPVMERDHAQRAGLGWIGKNTMLINPDFGSWLLLGELLTTASIPPDDPFEADRCGTCTRCIDACPTNAITPRRVDARLCISYLTIELRGSIPIHLRPAVGSRVFGCDICQDVCPWNDDAPACAPGPFQLKRPYSPFAMVSWAEELLELSDAEFRSRYSETPLARPGREAMLRNLCVGLGNSGETSAVPALMRCLDEPSPIVREHAAWALGRLAEVRQERSVESVDPLPPAG